MWDFPLVPEQAGSQSARVDAIAGSLALLSLVIFLIVGGLIVGLAVRYRRSNRVNRVIENQNTLPLEATWIALPFLVGMGLFGWNAVIYTEMRAIPEDAIGIYVVGKQWMWKYQHPDGPSEINDLHVPVGQPVRLTMTSQDVIHSFYVPAFRTKMDVLPGRYTTTWFEALEPGEYHIFCAEYCGTEHSLMVGKVIAMPPSEYQQWLTNQSAGGGSMAGSGEQLVELYGCMTCHAEGGAIAAPTFEGLFGSRVELADGSTVTADEEYLRRSILDPQAQVVAGYQPIMPNYGSQLSREDLNRIVEYLKSRAAESGDEP